MSPSEVRSLKNVEILEMLVALRPGSDTEAVIWLASVISDPVAAEGVSELSRRYTADKAGKASLPRARSAGTVRFDGAKLKEVMWRKRLPLKSVGPMIDRSEGLVSVLCHKGHVSYWTLDAIATVVLACRVEDLIAEIATDEELKRLGA